MALPETINVGSRKDGGDGDEDFDAWAKLVVNLKYLDQAKESKLDATAAALLFLLDALPTLPTNPAAYPAQGGLFRDGDANGYRLVRIFPAS